MADSKEAVKTDASQTATNAAQPDVGKEPPSSDKPAAAEPGPGNAPERPPSREDQLAHMQKEVPAPRSRTRPMTSAGPLDPDDVMTESELWQRAEAEHLDRNHREVERAAALGELIAVESALDSDRVAFSEYNEAHPHGFAYVAGRDTPPCIVGNTPLVQQAMLDRKIRRVSDEGVIPAGEQREAARR